MQGPASATAEVIYSNALTHRTRTLHRVSRCSPEATACSNAIAYRNADTLAMQLLSLSGSGIAALKKHAMKCEASPVSYRRECLQLKASRENFEQLNRVAW
jgi:hypothetical protein